MRKTSKYRQAMSGAERPRTSRVVVPGRSCSRRAFVSRGYLPVILCGLIGVGIGSYRIWSVEPEYAATARLYIEPTDALSDIEADPVSRGTAGQAWAQPTDLLVSAEVANSAVETAGLRSLPCFANADDLPLQILTSLSHKTSPASSGRGQIQELSFRCTDPDAAEKVLEGIVSAYATVTNRWHAQRIDETMATLQNQQDLVFERLQRKHLEYEEFKAAQPPGSASDTTVTDGRLKALVEARVEAELRRIDAEVRASTLKSMTAQDQAPLSDALLLDVLGSGEGATGRTSAGMPASTGRRVFASGPTLEDVLQ